MDKYMWILISRRKTTYITPWILITQNDQPTVRAKNTGMNLLRILSMKKCFSLGNFYLVEPGLKNRWADAYILVENACQARIFNKIEASAQRFIQDMVWLGLVKTVSAGSAE